CKRRRHVRHAVRRRPRGDGRADPRRGGPGRHGTGGAAAARPDGGGPARAGAVAGTAAPLRRCGGGARTGAGVRARRPGTAAGTCRSRGAGGRFRHGRAPGQARVGPGREGRPPVPTALGNAAPVAPGRRRCAGRGLRAGAARILHGRRTRARLMSVLSDRSRDALAEGGALAEAIPAFAPRPGQQRLAEGVAEAFESRANLLAEAGTGTGKTYAYLVPALLSGLKTIVSTGTRALQDQLYHRDLPRVRDALGVGLKTALLKGRANYLCLYRVEQAKGEARFGDREQVSHFQRIVAWAGRTRMGDMAEL